MHVGISNILVKSKLLIEMYKRIVFRNSSQKKIKIVFRNNVHPYQNPKENNGFFSFFIAELT